MSTTSTDYEFGYEDGTQDATAGKPAVDEQPSDWTDAFWNGYRNGYAAASQTDPVPAGALPVAVIAHNYFGYDQKRTMVRPFGSPFGFSEGICFWHYPAAIAPQDAYLHACQEGN